MVPLILLIFIPLLLFLADMCTSPILIRNRYNYDRTYNTLEGRYVVPGSGRSYLSVPCGKCPSCQQQKVDSYVFRCMSEYEFVNHRALFVTLTYRPSCRPLYPHVSSLGSFPTMIPMWDKRAIQSMLKSLNEKTIYWYGTSVLGLARTSCGKITPEWSSFLKSFRRPFTYFVTCERGSFDIYTDSKGRKCFGTAAPHYHLLLFSQHQDIPVSKLFSLLRKCWNFGHIYPLVIKNNIKNSLREYDRDPSAAIRYCCSYCCKSESWDYGEHRLADIVWASHEDKLRYRPFTLVSNFLGLNWFSDSNFVSNYRQYLSQGVTVPLSSGKTRNINIPSYYLNRLRFIRTRLDSSDIFEVNDFVFTEAGNPYTDISQRYKRVCRTRLSPSSVLLPSVYNDDIVTYNLHRKADYWCRILREVSNISLSDILSLPGMSDCDTYILRSFPLISSDDFYQFIVDQLYTSEPVFLTYVFETLQSIVCARKKLVFIQAKHKYRSSLSDAIINKPNLFNVKPF